MTTAVGAEPIPRTINPDAETLTNNGSVARMPVKDSRHTQQVHAGIIQDWSTHHLAYTGMDRQKAAVKAHHDPRALASLYLRGQGKTPSPGAAKRASKTNSTVESRTSVASATTIQSQSSSGSGWAASLGPTMPSLPNYGYPAKFTFDITATPDCTNDFVVYALATPGTPTQANIVALNNLYSSGSASGGGLCDAANAGQPSVLFAFQTSTLTNGRITGSPSLSLDGTKVAFVETSGVANGGASLHVLTWGSGGGSPNSPIQPDPACAQSCLSTVTLGSSPTVSSPYIDYATDSAYVADGDGKIWKIDDVFTGVPALATNDPNWPISGACQLQGTHGLGTPVYINGTIYAVEPVGVLHVVEADASCADHAVALDTGNVSIVDTPLFSIQDDTHGSVFIFGRDGSGNTAVYQTDLSGTVLQTVKVVGDFGAPPSAGQFDNTYWNDPAASSGFLYFTSTGQTLGAALYRVGFSGSTTMNSAVDPQSSTLTNQGGMTVSSLVEFSNPFDTAPDTLFVLGTANCGDDAHLAAGCVRSFDIGSQPFQSIAVADLPATTVASGLVIDNAADPQVYGGASSIYFAVAGSAFRLGQDHLAAPPIITSLSIVAGTIGTQVTIMGSGFGASQGTSKVSIELASQPIVSWSDTQIVFTVAPGTPLGSLVVVVNVAGNSSNGVAFTVVSQNGTLSGTITRASDGSAIAGALVEALQSGSTITSTTTAADGTYSLSVLQGTYDVRVSATGYQGTVVPAVGVVAGTTTTVSTSLAGPMITGIAPASGSAGTSVTVTGTNFGTTAGSITFNGTAATPTSWSDTAVVASVPSGAASGPVVVTSSLGVASNSVVFTVTPALTSIAISPASASFALGSAQQFLATGMYADGSTRDVSREVTWRSSDGTIVSIDTAGNATGVGVGTATVEATDGSITAVTNVTVTAPPPPILSQIQPVRGGIGMTVTLAGQYFGPVQLSGSNVLFAGTQAAIQSWNNNQIVFVVPNVLSTTPPGPVLVTVTVLGNTSNAETFTLTEPLLITPDHLNLLIGASQNVQILNQDGSVLSGVTLTGDNSSVANIGSPVNPGDPFVLQALSAGKTNLMATLGDRSGEATVTIWDAALLPNGAFPPGTVAWASPQLGDFGRGIVNIAQAAPSSTSTPVLYAEDDSNGASYLRAFDPTGNQKWVWPGPGMASTFPALIAGDTTGGVLAWTSDSNFNSYLTRVDQAGNPVFNHPAMGYFEESAVGPDGTIYFVDDPLDFTNPAQVVAVDPNTGQDKFRIPVPASQTQDIGWGPSPSPGGPLVACIPGAGGVGNIVSVYGGLSVSSDGTIYLPVMVSNVVWDASGCDPGTNPKNPLPVDSSKATLDYSASLEVMKIQPNGTYSLEALDSASYSGTNWDTPVEVFQIIGRAVPDGQGSAYVTTENTVEDIWAGQTPPTSTAMIYRDTGGSYPSPVGFGSTSDDVLLIGNNNIGFTTGSSQVVSLDLGSGVSKWTWTSPNSAFLRLVMVTDEGGVTVENGIGSTTPYLVSIDPTGVGSPAFPSSSSGSSTAAASQTPQTAAMVGGAATREGTRLLSTIAVPRSLQYLIGERLAEIDRRRNSRPGLASGPAPLRTVAGESQRQGHEQAASTISAATTGAGASPDALTTYADLNWGPGVWNADLSGEIAQIHSGPLLHDDAGFWAQQNGNGTQNGMSVVDCGCMVQSTDNPAPAQAPLSLTTQIRGTPEVTTNSSAAATAAVPADCPICGLTPPSCTTLSGSNQTYLILVGDPGLKIHNVGNAFALAAQQEANDLHDKGNTVIACRVSSIQEFNAALTQNGLVTGQFVFYFGHSGPFGVVNTQTGQVVGFASLLNVGQNSGNDTNIGYYNYHDLCDINQGCNIDTVLSKNTSIVLNGCGTATDIDPDYYAQYKINIAQLLSNQLVRGVYGYDVGMYFSDKDANHDPYFGAHGRVAPNDLPVYMIPNGAPGHKLDNEPKPKTPGH
jgi:hypothetical protein